MPSKLAVFKLIAAPVCNPLDPEVCWRRAPEDAVDESGAGATDERKIDPVREQRALLDPLLAVRLHREARAARQPDRQRLCGSAGGSARPGRRRRPVRDGARRRSARGPSRSRPRETSSSSGLGKLRCGLPHALQEPLRPLVRRVDEGQKRGGGSGRGAGATLSCLSSSSRAPKTPVRFPSGNAEVLSTRPSLTGSDGLEEHDRDAIVPVPEWPSAPPRLTCPRRRR